MSTIPARLVLREDQNIENSEKRPTNGEKRKDKHNEKSERSEETQGHKLGERQAHKKQKVSQEQYENGTQNATGYALKSSPSRYMYQYLDLDPCMSYISVPVLAH